MNIDTWKYLSQWLESDRDRFFLMISCRDLIPLNLMFHETHKYEQINKSQWYHNFTNLKVIIIDNDFIFPDRIKILSLVNNNVKIPPSVTHLELQYFSDDIGIPPTITHLKINDTYFEIERENIPLNIECIILNGDTTAYVPPNIKLLVVHCFYAGVIPESVTHLCLAGPTIGYLSKEFIPSGITHLTLLSGIESGILKIPDTIKHLLIPRETPIDISESINVSYFDDPKELDPWYPWKN